MAWSSAETAIPTEGGDPLTVTSTSTVCVVDASGYARLRMFGISAQQVMVKTSEAEEDVQEPPAAPIPRGDGLPLAYLESAAVPAATATADDYALRVVPRVSSGDYALKSTVIPARKTAMTLEGADAAPIYKDPHVLRLGDGRGWLMVLMRAHAPGVVLGAGGEGAGQDNCATAIVGYWAPDDDGTFSGPDVRGPVYLVSRVHDLDGARCVLWLSVPSAVEVEVGGTPYLFVYYMAERTHFDADGYEDAPLTFVAGTRMREIPLTALLGAFGIEVEDEAGDQGKPTLPAVAEWRSAASDDTTVRVAERSSFHDVGGDRSADIARLAHGAMDRSQEFGGSWFLDVESERSDAVGHLADWGQSARTPKLGESIHAGGGGDPLWDPTLSTDEELWTEDGTWLVPGTDRGKVRIWVAVGEPFVLGDAPLTTNRRGNVLIWEHYSELKDADAVPIWAGGQLVLFISANASTDEEPEVVGWGIWRCPTIASEVCQDYGIDFVVHPYVPDAGVEGERDLVVRSTRTAMRLDPDAIELPDGAWILYSGTTEAGAPTERREADAVSVGAGWAAAWT